MKNWRRLALYGIGGIVGLCLVCGIIGQFVSPNQSLTANESPAPVVVEVGSSSAASIPPDPSPTAIEPTIVPTVAEPTTTPEPTATAAPPTETPVPPTATPLPEPVIIQGTGQTVTEPFTLPFPITRARFEHTGSSNFIVQWYNAEDETELLINTIGNYAGEQLMAGDGEHFLEIDADGPWNVTLEPISFDETAADGLEGSGDVISGLFQPTSTRPTPYRFMHNGESNFTVYLTCASGRDLLQNEIGSVENEAVVRFGDGPCLWQVQADGAWTVAPR